MDVKVPQLGEGADSGTVVKVLVQEGDEVEKDQTLIELENEKAVAPIPSTAAGKVTKLHIKEGDKVAIGDVILSLSESEAGEAKKEEKADEETEEPKDKSAEEDEDQEQKPQKESRSKPKAEAEEQETKESKPKPKAEPEEGQAIKTGTGPPASPAIRKLARELGIDLTRVRGSERGGRIVQSDLRAYIERLQQIAFQAGGATRPAARRVDFSKWGSIYKRPVSSLRQAISRRMSEAWTTVPRVTQFDEADISDLMALKKKYDAAYEQRGARLTVTPFVLKALIPVLKEFPIFNASLDEAAGEIVFKEYFHFGVAVDTEHGLFVPVLRDVDRKSMLYISKEIEALAGKARDRKLSAEEMCGGSFTISNQGGIGGAHFTPIVNVPEVAILGLGRAKSKPVVRGAGIEPRMLMPLCLSYDHRVIDGGSAARFIAALVGKLESFSEDEVKL